MNSQKLIKKLNYFFLGFILLWNPFQMAFLTLDGKGRIQYALTFLVLFLNIVNEKGFLRKHVFSIPVGWWSVWFIYTAVNLVIKGHNQALPIDFFIVLHLMGPLMALILTRREILRDRDGTLKFLMVIFVAFMILAAFFLSEGKKDYGDRELGALGNLTPLTTLYLVFFTGILFIKNRLKLIYFIPGVMITFSVILASGTRKAFTALLLILFTIFISKFKFSARNFLLYVGLFAGVYFGYNYLMDNTLMGQRFEQTSAEATLHDAGDNFFLKLVGDRARNYVVGWDLFMEYPVTGVGIRNYKTATGEPLVLHTEYMVQFAEGGIIAVFFFFMFNYGVGKRVFVAWKKERNKSPEVWILISGFVSILFVGLTGWTYSFPHYFMLYGTILGYTESLKRERKMEVWLKRKELIRKKQSEMSETIVTAKLTD